MFTVIIFGKSNIMVFFKYFKKEINFSDKIYEAKLSNFIILLFLSFQK